MSTHICSIPACFDLPQTLDCGQAFRWRPLPEKEGAWQGVARGHALTLWESESQIHFSCTQEEFDTIWRPYFDLDADYEEKRAALSAISPVLAQAAAYAPGIRLLRQEPWEALCSFIISQNNNISRIKGILHRLCLGWGEAIPGSGLRAFPTPQALAEETPETLAPLRAGFRAKYLVDAAQKVASGEVDLQEIPTAPLSSAREQLQKIKGVGPKVAECALLYGFHRTECFPMDVWMKRAMETLLPGFSPADFGENAGLAQQYIFHYSRMHPELFR